MQMGKIMPILKIYGIIKNIWNNIKNNSSVRPQMVFGKNTPCSASWSRKMIDIIPTPCDMRTRDIKTCVQ